jgi:hypothetical protein
MPNSFGVAKAFRSGEFRDPGVRYGDFFVFNYEITTGADLDIRASFLDPTGTTGTLGWGRDNTLRSGTTTIAYWGGDNTGVGIESLYVDKAALLSAYPTLTQFTLDLRCFWNAVTGTDVIVNMDAYQGGSMVLNSNTHTWSNPTATNTFPAAQSILRTINFQSSNVETDGQRHSRVIVNFSAETVTYFAN